ncbi:urea transport protein [Colletotrichum tofieldiae]|nr:urea transport protein [Colletotrichum tofieldiae]
MSSSAALPSDVNILDRLASLPVELQHQVLFEFLTVSSPCALSLFVPDWGVCTHAADPVNAIYDLQRIDVYTRGAGVVKSRFETQVGHDVNNHVFFPMVKRTTPNDSSALMGELVRRFPAAMERALRDVERRGLRCFEQLWPAGPDDEIGKCMAGGALVFREQSEAARGRCADGLDTGPTAAKPAEPRHLMFSGFPRDPWRELRLRRNALTRFRLEMKLFVERGPELLAVEWSAMTQLETLYLDLRAYGRGQANEDSIRLGAAEMACLRLESLVIAGLRSGDQYVRYPGWQRCDWETDEKEVDGGVNWVKVFCGAVREGGSLVFVDRRMLDISWEGWRMRAEKEGLLPEVEKVTVVESGNAAYLRHVDKVLSGGFEIVQGRVQNL